MCAQEKSRNINLMDEITKLRMMNRRYTKGLRNNRRDVTQKVSKVDQQFILHAQYQPHPH